MIQNSLGMPLRACEIFTMQGYALHIIKNKGEEREGVSVGDRGSERKR